MDALAFQVDDGTTRVVDVPPRGRTDGKALQSGDGIAILLDDAEADHDLAVRATGWRANMPVATGEVSAKPILHQVQPVLVTLVPPPTTPPSSVRVTGDAGPVAAGVTEELQAFADYGDGMPHDVTTLATWTSDATLIATVDAGHVQTKSTGMAQITANYDGVKGSVTITVAPPVVQTLQLMPQDAMTGVLQSQQFTATAYFSDGTHQDVTTESKWTSSNAAVATISSSGKASTLAPGMTTITAAYSGQMKTATLTVQ